MSRLACGTSNVIEVTAPGPGDSVHRYRFDAAEGWSAIRQDGDSLSLASNPVVGLPLLERPYEELPSALRPGQPNALPYARLVATALGGSAHWANLAASWLERAEAVGHVWPRAAASDVGEASRRDALPQVLRHRLGRLYARWVRTGRYKLAVQTGGYGVFAEVGLELLPHADDEVVAADLEHTPEDWKVAALSGARAASIPDGHGVRITRLVGTHVDTTQKAMAAAGFVAALQALGVKPPVRERLGTWHQHSSTGHRNQIPTRDQLQGLVELDPE